MENQDAIDIDEGEIESDLPTQNTLESENQSNVEPPKKKSRISSNVWGYFENLGIVNDKPRAKCNGCAKKFCAGGNKYGVSSLRRHMGICLHLKNKFQDIGESFRDNEGKARNQPLNQKVLREKIAMAIVRHDLPLSFVEYDGIWDVLNYCNPSVKRFSRGQVATKTGKSQLDIYLEESTLQWNHFVNLDVLQFWNKNTYRFPELALMASDILSIPITTVASESAFSIGSRILTKYRSCLLPTNVQAAICLRNWNHGFIAEDDDEDSTPIATVSRADSNSHEDGLQEADKR